VNTLRARLIFAQVLPWLLVAPLIGLTLYALLETQQSLTQLSTELEEQAYQTARLTETQPDVFSNSAQAELFIDVYVTEMGVDPAIKLTLLTPEGDVLGTNLAPDPAEAERQLSLLPQAISEIRTTGFFYVKNNLAMVMIPVMDLQDQVLGLVAAAETVDQSTARLPLMRNLLIIALIGELMLGVLIGLGMADYLGRDLRNLTDALARINQGSSIEPLPEHGPQEIRLLITAYNDAVDRLQVAEESRRQLLANIVHELGRPLGALQSAVQALQRGGDDDPAFRSELLDGMAAQIGRLQPLLDNLTQLHGQIPGNLEIDRRSTDLNLWLPDLIAPWKAAAYSKSLRWIVEIPAVLPEIDIDPDRMAQAVGNLLSNAVKYTPAGGQVKIAVADRGDLISFTVRDTGVGIETDEIDQIFEPFYRSSLETRFPQGMGLGLSIAREIVNAHGGQLNVKSNRGQGSLFEILLPVAAK
jgi:signal transduction histidine kinase